MLFRSEFGSDHVRGSCQTNANGNKVCLFQDGTFRKSEKFFFSFHFYQLEAECGAHKEEPEEKVEGMRVPNSPGRRELPDNPQHLHELEIRDNCVKPQTFFGLLALARGIILIHTIFT